MSRSPSNITPSPHNSPIIASKSQSRIPYSTLLLILLLFVIVISLGYLRLKPKNPINSYQECIDHPQSLIRESYPQICVAYTGQEFTQILPTPTLTPPTPTPDPIPTDWQTFKLKSASFGLPPDWQQSTTATTSSEITYSFRSNSATTSAILTLTIKETTSTNPLLSYLTQAYQLNNRNISTQSATLDNQPAIFVTTPNNFSFVTSHPQTNRIIEIIHSANFESFADLADSILASFRFSPASTTLIQSCPEAWYSNQMPQIVPDDQPLPTPETYFIYNGKRVETNQVDVDWVTANCDQKSPQPVF
jgi:hypothetical protein